MSTKTLVEKLIAANLAYRNTETLLMTDEEYDEGIATLRKLEPNHPFLSLIGADVQEGGKGKTILLPSKMASLDKILYGEGTLEKWKKKCASQTSPSYVISEKLDGISCLYVSDNGGRLYLRGNGVKGVDVSGLLNKIRLQIYRPPGNFIVRGELILRKSDTPKGSIGRSLMNGWVHRSSETLKEMSDIRFIAYQVIRPSGMTRRQEFEWLRNYFEIPWIRFVNEFGLKEDLLKKFLIHRRAESEYATDGLVVATDTVPQMTGEELKNPKDAIAFKAALDEQKCTTIVKGIEWNISRHGIFIPTILIEPIVIGDAKIERLSGHNAATIVKHSLGPGARIIVRRSGDVIPTLDTVLEGCPTGAALPLSSWKWDENKTHACSDIYSGSESPEGEGQTRIKTMVHGLQTLEIPGIGEGIVEKLVEGKIDTLKKLWSSSPELLASLIGPGRGPKLLENFRSAISKAPPITLMIASNMLPRGVGERKLKLLFEIQPDPSLWTSALFVNVKGWGLTSIDELLAVLPKILIWIKDFPFTQVSGALPLAGRIQVKNGKSVVFTGVREKVLEERLVSLGWEIQPTITKNTTVLIVPDTYQRSASSASASAAAAVKTSASQAKESGKIKKAVEYGIRIERITDFKESLDRSSRG